MNFLKLFLFLFLSFSHSMSVFFQTSVDLVLSTIYSPVPLFWPSLPSRFRLFCSSLLFVSATCKQFSQVKKNFVYKTSYFEKSPLHCEMDWIKFKLWKSIWFSYDNIVYQNEKIFKRSKIEIKRGERRQFAKLVKRGRVKVASTIICFFNDCLVNLIKCQ